jgi:hypothetical protein
VKYADELVLQSMIDRLIEIGTCCGMGMMRKKGNENLKATITSTDYDKLETTGQREIFQLFW